MKTSIRLAVLACFVLFLLASSPAQSGTPVTELEQLLDSAKVIEAPVFAPQTYLNAEKKLGEVKSAILQNRKQKAIDELVSDFQGYAENAIKASGVAKLSLSEYLGPRGKALAAKAHLLVPISYRKAEDQFVKGTKKVESGDVKGGLKEAERAIPLFDAVELEAIKVDIMGAADKAIATAVADEAPQYALSTLDKARTARAKANDIISKDRYERKESIAFAIRAEYEAWHASNIAQSVRSLKRNDQAWEKLILVYEIEMQKVAMEAGIEFLKFNDGPLAAADSLVKYIRDLKLKNDTLEETLVAHEKQIEKFKAELTDQMKATLARTGSTPQENDPIKLAQGLDTVVANMQGKVNQLSGEMQSKEGQLTELEKNHQEVTAELQVRQQKEDKVKTARALINPSEGEIIFNSTGDIVLRLSGLSFDISSAEIKDKQVPLLKKVEEIIQLFPNSKLMVEGHTDNAGDPTSNMRLSEKRAFAVMQFIRQALSISEINAAGYGSEKPVASNDTPEGRAKNRRIDIIIWGGQK
ncbi:MAG: OmpA family protein [candidate division Zixibacteria bacterium]|nr:OmpA family protein [candidate division Zixibacteria bacterium]